MSWENLSAEIYGEMQEYGGFGESLRNLEHQFGHYAEWRSMRRAQLRIRNRCAYPACYEPKQLGRGQHYCEQHTCALSRENKKLYYQRGRARIREKANRGLGCVQCGKDKPRDKYRCCTACRKYARDRARVLAVERAKLPRNPCKVEDCERPRRAGMGNHFCERHWQRTQRRNRKPRPPTALLDMAIDGVCYTVPRQVSVVWPGVWAVPVQCVGRQVLVYFHTKTTAFVLPRNHNARVPTHEALPYQVQCALARVLSEHAEVAS